MKKIVSALLLASLVGCSSSDNSSQVASPNVNLEKLPVTVTGNISLMYPDAEGAEFTGGITINGEEVMFMVSESKVSSANIPTDRDFEGKATITISEEHEFSNAYTKFYSVSKISR